MTRNFKKYFAGERARALAIMFLTRRDDLIIEDAKEGLGLDFLVSIARKDEPPQPRFGIVLKAAIVPVTLEQAGQVVAPPVRDFQRRGTFPYPVCLFFFTMRDDRGYYTWLREPTVTKQGRPRLSVCAEPDCKVLDEESLSQLVETINAWYDALYADLTA